MIFVESQALCRDSSIYRLKLLTSPEGNLPIPTPNPTFFYANKGCNSGDLTYECGIPVHPYFLVLSAFENQTVKQLVPCICKVCQLDISNIDRYFPFLIEFWQFIQHVEYILTCQIQSSPQFSIFWTNLQVDNIITFRYPIFTPICWINSTKTG